MRRTIPFIISFVIFSLGGVYFIAQKNSLRRSENQEGLTGDARKARAFEILGKDLNTGESIDSMVESLEKFQSDSKIRDNAGALLKKRLTTTAAQIGLASPEISHPGHSVVIILPTEVMFEKATIKLSAPAKILLKEVVHTIEPFGNEFTLTVTGHTAPGDFSKRKSTDSSGDFDAWIFSASRAASVVSELIKQGARPNRLRATGLADTRGLFPVRQPDGSLNSEASKKNQRIEIEITSLNNTPVVRR